VAVTLFFVALAGAQLAGRNAWTFPLVEWEMYSRSPPMEPIFFRYGLVLPHGEVKPFDVTRAFPSLSWRVLYLLARTGRRLGDAPGGVDLTRWEAIIRAVGRATARRANAAAVAVHVERCVLRVLSSGGTPEIACRPFRDVALREGGDAA
jgi:hypothetical protein